MDEIYWTVAQLSGAALILWSASGCVEEHLPRADRCLEGTTATPDGCRAVPNWNPWRDDAGTAAPDAEVRPHDGGPPVDAGSRDGGTSTGTTAPRDGGVLPEEFVGLAGTWGLRTVNAQVVNNQYVGQAVVDTIVLSLVEIQHDGDRMDLTSRVCSIVSEAYGDTTTVHTPTFIAALPGDQATATISPDDVGGVFRPTMRRRLIGWVAAQDPENEPVPDNDEDGRLIDADQDGNPGITLGFTGAINGDLYFAQRTTIELDGIVESWSRVTGTSRTTIERNELGASNPLLRAGDTTRRPHSDPARSPFEMVRVPRSMDCNQLETILNPMPRGNL